MKFKVFCFFIFFAIGLSSAQISCRYAVDGWRYTCFLTIQNSGGLDNFSTISGTHLSGYTNNHVNYIQADEGNTPIFPQIICRQFPNTIRIDIVINIGLYQLTELSFANCFNLDLVRFDNNYITEIAPATFRNNVKLYWFDLRKSRITTLPEDLFSNARYLEYIEIGNAPTLSDLPANIFKDLNRLKWLRLYSNRLTIWRPEWIQNLANIEHVHIYRNYHIPEVPRNAINTKNLVSLYIDVNYLRVLDYFSFNDVSSAVHIHIGGQPIDAIDFNFIDGAKSVRQILLENANCYNGNIYNIELNRTEYYKLLEPCFLAFDKRVLGKLNFYLK